MNLIIISYMVVLFQTKNIYSMEDIFNTYDIVTKRDDIWKLHSNSSKQSFCEGIFYGNGFQLMCVPDKTEIPCNVESEKIDMKNYQGKNLKITLRNIGEACDGCTLNDVKNPSGTLVITQHVGNDILTDFLELKPDINSKVLNKEKGIDAISFTLSVKRICKKVQIIISSTVCKAKDKSKGLVILPNTTLPAPNSKEISITELKCVENALVKVKPFFKCFSNGSYEVTGSCQCKPNYELADDSKCQPCASTSYKFEAGNEKCTKCMNGSMFIAKDNKCICKTNYARDTADLKKVNAICYKLPSRPTIQISDVTYTSVVATFDIKDFKGRFQVLLPYNVVKEISESHYKMKNLEPNTEYNITVIAENDVIKRTGKKLQDTKTFWTSSKRPGPVLNIKIVDRKLYWDRVKDSGSVYYVLKIKDENRTISATVKESYYSLEEFKSSYISIKIHAEVVGSEGIIMGEKTDFTHTLSRISKQEEKKNNLHLIIGGSVGGFLLILIIIMIILLVQKHRKPQQFEVTRMEDGTMTIPRMTLFKTSRLYVDPTTYSHVDEAVEEFAMELDRGCVTMDQLIGGGEFANVFKGILKTDSRNTDVAIKVLKSGANRNDRDDFLSEAAILGQFSDPNVITIEGVVLKDYPSLIVLEYMQNGSLDNYLVKNDSQFSTQKLLGMVRGVASGMKYLSDLGFIHRDLAARNVLVNNEDVCKIADFGMSRELKTDDTYDTKGGKIPIKWTSPEAIEFKKFTTASDVWSYGILCWEIFSYGERPYWEWTNYEVIERLSTGYRLPPPMECPKVIHDLMLQCWNKDRLKRPRFTNILQKVEEWLKNPDRLTEIASVITKRDENLDYSVLDDLSSWLEAINMKQYLKMFTESGYMTPKDILYLTNEDLEALGVGLIGHRKKLLKSIKNTKNQNEDDSQDKSNKLNRSTSFAGFGSSLSKKVSFLASPNSSISFKKTVGKRTSLGYQLQ